MKLNLSNEIFSPILGPNENLLWDKKLLSQAWKKTNIFIRENNWYMDSLELELFSFNIENNLSLLTRKTIKNPKVSIVPVPKTTKWIFEESKSIDFDSWRSETKENGEIDIELRGIALVGIDMQVRFTTMLICMAEAIETLQKKIQTELDELLHADFYSYGNRLQCIWTKEDNINKAIFQTGSSLLYEKYFHNYKLFLRRPLEIAKYYHECLSSQNKIYIINLDITKFFDSIDTDLLIELMKKQLKSYYEDKKSFSEVDIINFINVVKNQFEFKYDTSLEKDEIITKISGLPQGLAASGFFSNIYLMDFDESIGREKNRSIILKKKGKDLELVEDKADANSMIIRDYCRYVDDIRLVIEVNKDLTLKEIENKIFEIMDYFLEKSINEKSHANLKLSFNKDKFELIDYQYHYRKPISQILNSHRTLLSGTPTIEDVSNNLDSLKSLFLSSLSKSENETTNNLSLSKINTEQWDVKDSTVKKFIATELKKNLVIKSKVLPSQFENNNTLNSAYRKNELEKQNISKILLSAWSKDPSLIYLLKISLEINPSRFNLKSLIESLELKLFPNVKDLRQLREHKVALYLIGQLYNLGFELLFKKHNNTDLSKYNCLKDILSSFLEKLVYLHNQKKLNLPFYVTQNLILFSVAISKRSLDLRLLPSEKSKLENYFLLENLATSANSLNEKELITKILPLALIKNQFSSKNDQFINWFVNIINSIENKELKQKFIHKLFQEDNILFRIVFSNNCSADIDDYTELVAPYKYYLSLYKTSKTNLINNKPISLMKVILSENNPFSQENALLLLAQQLYYNGIDSLKNISLLDIDVTCSNWGEIQNPHFYSEGFFKVNPNSHNEKDKLLKFRPFWLDDKLLKSKKHLNHYKDLEYFQGVYNLGIVLRSCILGDFHHTSTRNILDYSKNRYYGFKNTYFSRSFGLDNSIQQLSNRSQPITPWMSEFIFYCLRWPYAHFTIEMEIKYNNISKLINDRISYQKNIYGNLTKLPMYVYPVILSDNNTSNSIKVGIVQTVLPKPLDFDIKNPLYWSKENKSLQRNHLINICNLIERHLIAYNTTNQEQHIDLLVFPEVSVHEDDIDILRRLVYKTKTNIFAGLMFMQNPNNTHEVVNQGLWMIHDKENDKENILELYQGKGYVTSNENKMGIKGYRPYQLIIEFNQPNNGNNWKVTGSICYDSTDLKLAADLRDITDAFVIAAYNKDIQTFDNMASSLSYHMYQPIILSNIGIYGGSTIQAPFSGHNKLIAHLHGHNQIGIGIFEIDMNEFKNTKKDSLKIKTKTPPAGYKGRNLD